MLFYFIVRLNVFPRLGLLVQAATAVALSTDFAACQAQRNLVPAGSFKLIFELELFFCLIILPSDLQ